MVAMTDEAGRHEVSAKVAIAAALLPLLLIAGVHGASAAYHLAQSGARVTVVERLTPAAGPTGLSSGVCRAYYTNSFLAEAENGVHLPGGTLDLPSGTRIVVVGTLMALVLIVRPAGLTAGREVPLPRAFLRGVLTKFSA